MFALSVLPFNMTAYFKNSIRNVLQHTLFQQRRAQEQEIMGFGFLRSNVNNICMKGEGEGAQCLVSFFFAIQIHPESPFF